MEMPVFVLTKKGIEGYTSIDEFFENVKDKVIYVIDKDSLRGKDINFKILSKLSKIYEVWYEFNARWMNDVSDVLISGAKVAVMSGDRIKMKLIKHSLEITEDLALRSEDFNTLKYFVENGGKIIISSIHFENVRNFKIVDGKVVEV